MQSLRRYVTPLALLAALILVWMENPWFNPEDVSPDLRTASTIAFWVLAVAVLTDRAHIAVFLVLALVDGVCTAFSGPARATAIQAVVPKDQLKPAYAQEEARGHAARVAGPPLGALLMAAGRAVPFVSVFGRVAPFFREGAGLLRPTEWWMDSGSGFRYISAFSGKVLQRRDGRVVEGARLESVFT